MVRGLGFRVRVFGIKDLNLMSGLWLSFKGLWGKRLDIKV